MAKTNHITAAPKPVKNSVHLEASLDSSRSLGEDDSFSVVGSENALPSFDKLLDRDETEASSNQLDEKEVKKYNSEGPLNEGNTVPLKNFSNLFKGNCLDECKLEEFPIADGPVAFEDEDLVSIADEWSHSLIGSFSDKFPGLKVIKALVDSWKVRCKIIPHNEAWVLLKFENDQDLERVLFGGPYTVYNRAFFLQKLPKYFNFCNVSWTVPVWVRLPGLPLDC
ncbi:hypothetical protein ACS0TY_025220 [Phlomoides rotata]